MVSERRPEQVIVRRRMEAVFLGFVAVLVVIAARLFVVQVVQAKDFAAMADKMQVRPLQIDAVRGPILDRNGNELATNVLAKTLLINPRVPKDPDATAARLGELLRLTEPEVAHLARRIRQGDERRSGYLRLRRGVERKLAQRVLDLSTAEPALKGIWLENSPQRVNPSGTDGRQLIGSVNVDGEGIEATEKYFESLLHGKDGARTVRVNALGVPIPNSETRMEEPKDGKPVRLTLDRDLQHIVEAELAKLEVAQSPDAATAVVMDVHTGEVLAMANLPGFNATEKDSDRAQAQRRNRAVTDLYEPGSTFKVITAGAALEYGVETTTNCPGSRAIGKHVVKCAHGASHGRVDLRKMIEKSCNLGAGTLAQRVGPEHMMDFIKAMGLQSKTGIEFPGEEYSTLMSWARWNAIKTVTVGFGQGVSVTPIQLLAAYAAIANDGVYNPPKLVLEAQGWEPEERPSHRVMTVKNTQTLRSYMEGVVTNGTGTAAKIPGYSVAGKTGTAQISEGRRGYGSGKVASFVGFVPAQSPRIAILVSAWRPKRGEYGGVVAAPVFREIARQCVLYLKVAPDTPEDERDGALRGGVRSRSGGSRD